LDIIFEKNKFKKECNDDKLLVRRYGSKRAKLINRRLDEIRAAKNLEILRTLPGPRLHEYSGNYKGLLSVDLDGPYRLIIEPANNPIPKKEDGGLDWSKVTAARIKGIIDPHG